MALLGQGDSRWIVEEREDGANVNNWHWTEKDCKRWAEHRFAELLTGMQLTEGTCEATITDTAPSVTGDVILNQRKKKLIPMYELEVKATFAGKVLGSDGTTKEVEGQIVMPYIADENHDEDTEVKVTLKDDNDAAAKELKAAILKHSKQKIVDAVKVFVEDLQAGKPVGHVASAAPVVAKTVVSSTKAATNSAKPAAQAAKDDTKRGTNTIVIKESFYAGSKDIFEVFTDAQRVRAFTQSDATIEAVVGSDFTMFGGSIVGVQRELTPHTRIVQDWRFSNWEEGLYSKVVIDIEELQAGTTNVTMTQTGVPHEDKYGHHNVVETTENGWRNLILRRIKTVFGYGA